jgi:hypothetical protein
MINTATLYTILAGYTVLGGLALIARKPQDAEDDRHPKLNFGVGASVAFIGLYLTLANLPLLGWTAMFLGVTLALYAFLEALLTIHDNQQHTHHARQPQPRPTLTTNETTMTTTQQPNTSDEKRQLQVTASDLAALLTDAIGPPGQDRRTVLRVWDDQAEQGTSVQGRTLWWDGQRGAPDGRIRQTDDWLNADQRYVGGPIESMAELGRAVLAWWDRDSELREEIDTEEDLREEARDSAEIWLGHQPHLHAEDGIPATMHRHNEHGTEDVRLVTDLDELRDRLREWAASAAEAQLRQALDVPDEEA